MLLFPDLDEENVNAILEEAMVKLKDKRNIHSTNFPSKWNSGRNLQIIIYSLTRILAPMLIIETGTANGTSANSWASGLNANSKGKLFTIVITKTTLPAVDFENMKYIECIISDGSVENLSQIVKSVKNDNSEYSIFLHDSDHSYFGQFTDYELAKLNKFNLLISDDIDSSMAFIDFTINFNTVVMYDERKFIGAVVL
jgi:predicted O-methyltransferase YrrM